MLVCAILCTIQAVNNLGTPIFARMVVSLISTYGVFIVSSVLALDPWFVAFHPFLHPCAAESATGTS